MQAASNRKTSHEVSTIPAEDFKPGYRYWPVRPGYESAWTVSDVQTRQADVQVMREGQLVTPELIVITYRDGRTHTFDKGEQVAIQGPWLTEGTCVTSCADDPDTADGARVLGYGVRATTEEVIPCDSEATAQDLAADKPHLSVTRLTADGWEPAPDTIAVPRAVADVFISVLGDAAVARQVRKHLTAIEARVLAELFDALGAQDAAVQWQDGHADTDSADGTRRHGK